MPGFGFHLPRFLRSHRSSRSHSSPTNPRNDVATSHPPSPSPSPALSPRPSSTYGIPRPDAHVATATSYLSTSSSLITGRLGVDRAVENCGDRASHISQQGTPVNTLDSISVPNPRRPDSTSQQSIHLPHLLDSTDSAQLLHPPCPLATPSQQSLISERPTVSLSFKLLISLRNEDVESFKATFSHRSYITTTPEPRNIQERA
jgi:hypothetical protein